MRYIRSNQVEWIDGKGYKKGVFIKDVDLLSRAALIQYIAMNPHTEVKSHYHKKTTEVFYFLEGEGSFTIEDKEFKPKIGDVLICEANEKHSTINDNDKTWKYLAFKTDVKEPDLFWTEEK